MKKLFVYYSYTGNGDEVAEYLRVRGYDLRMVQRKKKLPKSFFFGIMTGGFLAGIKHKDKLVDFDENTEPVSGDEDYVYNETWSDENKATYYVHFYAVGVAMDTTTCTYAYSLVLDLGIIPIRKDSN